MIYLSKNIKETHKIAVFLLEKMSKLKWVDRCRQALVVALEGELGAGKTTFVQGFAKALQIKSKIKSPTFVIIKKYRLNPDLRFKISNLKFIYHLDCYRLRNHLDLKTLGIKEIFKNPENVVLIEWSDRIKSILPKNHIQIHIDHVSKNKRKIEIK